MSNFASINNAVVVSTLSFTALSNSSLQQFSCQNGELAGFRIFTVTALGIPFEISQIYNCSSGIPVQVGNVSVLPGIDLTGGYFSSGCFCDKDPLSVGTKFYKVNYGKAGH